MLHVWSGRQQASSVGSASSTLNTNFGPLWLQPSLLQDGRMVQFSANVTF